MSKFVIGLHGFSAHSDRLLHDTGACLIQEGKIISAINEERLSRIKHDGHFPHQALNKILEINQIPPDEIAALAFPDKKPLWQTFHVIKNILKTYRETSLFLNKYLMTSLQRTLDYKRLPPTNLATIPQYFVEHHLCHAASAYYTCPWDDVAIVTLDGMGDYSIGGTINLANKGKIRTLYRTNGFYSPGLFYMFVTCLLGYKAGRHEGKITGLAAYGDAAKCYELVKPMIS